MSKLNGCQNGQHDLVLPKAAATRLSLYLRELENRLITGQETVSSNQLGSALNITDAQVRKDLAYFGQFGYPGIGYRVCELRNAIKGVLGTNRTWQTALIGIGNLGRALLNYGGFEQRGFIVAGLFDRDPSLIGRTFNGLDVYPLERLPEVATVRNLELAIIAVPAIAAEEVAQVAVDAGISGILNFAPVQLKLPDDVSVVSVDLGLQLEQLAFQVTQRQSGKPPIPL